MIATTHTCQLPADRHNAIGEAQHVAARGVVNEFLRRRSTPEILRYVSFGLDPVKEITESCVSWLVVCRWLEYRRWSLGDAAKRLLVVGDGRTPRTGVIAAASSAWDVWSVDPLLRPKDWHAAGRLTTVAAPLELRDGRAWAGPHDVTASFDVVVAVHSHAPVDATRAACKPGGVLVALPCCVAWPLDRGETWVDDRVLSPDRRFVVEPGAAP